MYVYKHYVWAERTREGRKLLLGQIELELEKEVAY